MLLEFSVGNFRSFQNVVTFSMVAANVKAKNESLNLNNLFESGNINLLKSAAIYGANASGKSNLVKALEFMRTFVLRSHESNSEDNIEIEPFQLDISSSAQPSFFEIIFRLNDIRYRYGFEVSKSKVHAEWLFRTIKRESELFWREDDEFEIKTNFKEGRGLEIRTRANVLFLSVCDQWNGSIAGNIIHWFKQIGFVSGIDGSAYLGFTVNQFLKDENIKNKIHEYMRQMDLGVTGIAAERVQGLPNEVKEMLESMKESKIPDELRNALSDDTEWFTPSVRLLHKQFDNNLELLQEVEFDFEEQESEGTKKAFSLSGPILHTLSKGHILIVDELDARLHPLMTRYIIGLFNSKTTNPNNAQFIFATHDTNLLSKELLRRDQIWFTEKNKRGSTDLYSLVEYKVRNDASYESDYIAGKYGAIPFIGDISFLFEEQDAKA